MGKIESKITGGGISDHAVQSDQTDIQKALAAIREAQKCIASTSCRRAEKQLSTGNLAAIVRDLHSIERRLSPYDKG